MSPPHRVTAAVAAAVNGHEAEAPLGPGPGQGLPETAGCPPPIVQVKTIHRKSCCDSLSPASPVEIFLWIILWNLLPMVLRAKEDDDGSSCLRAKVGGGDAAALMLACRQPRGPPLRPAH